MIDPLRPYRNWIGTWAGPGEAQTGAPVIVRQTFELYMDGHALLMHFEAMDPDATRLYHGVRSLLRADNHGVLHAAAYSTIHGCMLFDATPDDEGVLALAAQSPDGNLVNVTFVEEASDALLFTAGFRPPRVPLDTPGLPRMHARLKRLLPVNFSAPPGAPRG